jgi:hypothetical protein
MVFDSLTVKGMALLYFLIVLLQCLKALVFIALTVLRFKSSDAQLCFNSIVFTEYKVPFSRL